MANKGTKADRSAIVVGGDFIVDHHIYQGARHHYGDSRNRGVRVVREDGGAKLVDGLLAELLASGNAEKRSGSSSWKSYPTASSPKEPEDGQKAYAFWRPFSASKAGGKPYWRASEAMGYGEIGEELPSPVWPAARGLPAEPEIVVFSDGGLGFRRNPDCWKSLALANARWIVLKTSAPVATGPLWDDLVGHHPARLVVVVSAQELRKSASRISAGLSWESTIEDLLRELSRSHDLEGLTRCARLIVTFGVEGAVCLEMGSGKDAAARVDAGRVQLVYEPSSIEGARSRAIEGRTFGFLSCMAAAVAWQMTLDLDNPDFTRALECGLAAMRDLIDRGHGEVTNPGLGFPAERLAEVMRKPPLRLSRASFAGSAPAWRDPSARKNAAGVMPWSLLADSQRNPERADEPTYNLGNLVLLHGAIALSDVPHMKVRNLVAVNRDEVETLRGLEQLISRYRDHDPGKSPLAIGVFGPPGAGKSFAVSELAGELVGEKNWLEFNLSQFDSLGELNGAFHQVRDRRLRGDLPVAFFDEFDSRSYHWLQYLLAPLQDGKFQVGALTHTLGKCIFVFAGATSWTFETFGPPPPSKGADEDDRRAYRDFRMAKGPDFKSRLDGYLNVVGPNHRRVALPADDARVEPGTPIEYVSGHRFTKQPADICFPVRRALMLRSKLRCSADEKLEIDPGLASAMLQVDRFVHGARSLDKILQPLQVARPGRLQRSWLPSREQLSMHTEADEFLALCDTVRLPADGSLLGDAEVEVVAAAIHEVWRRAQFGTDPKRQLKDPQDADFKDLPESYMEKGKKGERRLGRYYQESNRAAARRMSEILELVGLRLEREAWSGDDEAAVRQRIEYHLELLADAEHHGWMQWHLDQGWRHDAVKDPERKRHDCLLPFLALPEHQKQKDRNSVRHYPDFAKAAGMRIARFARKLAK